MASIVVLVALGAAVLLLDARPFMPFATSTGRYDNASFNFPIRLEVARQWHEGRLPLWNPWQFAGFPLLGDITSGAFYPGNLPFVLDPESPRYRALDQVAAMHFVLAALCMYAFARALELGRAAASLAALVYGGNGFLLFLASRWIQAQNSAVWLPLILAAVLRAGRPGGLGLWVAIGAVAVALQTLSGYPQYVFYTGLIAGALALVTAGGRSTERWRPVVAVVAIYALGAALSAVQLLPAMEVAALSRRGQGITLDEFVKLAASPDVLGAMLLPRRPAATTHPFVVFGSVFVGTLTAALALEGARSRARTRVFLTTTLVVGFLLAIGPFTPLGTLAFEIPGLNAFRYPFKHLLEVMLCISALAGFGAQAVLDGGRGTKSCVALAAAATGLWALTVVLELPGRHWAFYVSAVGALLFALLVVLDRRREALVVALVCIWLTLAGNRSAIFTFDAGKIRPPSPTVETLTKRPGTVLGPRYAAATWVLADDPDLVALDYPTEFRVPSVHGTSPFVWGPLRDALEMSENGNFTKPSVLVYPVDQTLDLLGVRYVGSLTMPFGKPVIQDRPSIVAERPRALPVIRFVDRAVCLDAAATSEELHRRKYQFASVALLDCDDKPPLPEIAAARLSAQVSLTRGEPGYLRMVSRLRTDAPGVLVVSQADMPGWRARVDGAEVPIYRAYGIVQAIVVPPGVHDVELEYLPRSFVTGSVISIVALVALVGGLGACVATRRRGRGGDAA